MDELKVLRGLASAAGQAGPPAVDVAASVVGDIRARRATGGAAWWAAAGLSAAAAAVAAAVALHAWADWQDPLRALFAPVVMVIQ